MHFSALVKLNFMPSDIRNSNITRLEMRLEKNIQKLVVRGLGSEVRINLEVME
jgi:hypothetical protein